MSMSRTEDDDVASEERGIYAIITMACAPVVIGLWIEGGTFDAGSTLSLVLMVAGVIGLLAGLRALMTHRIPRATVHRDL